MQKYNFLWITCYLCILILFESMLNRRILRSKAFKAIYCYAENPGLSLKETHAFLESSCESTRDLYLFMLSIIGPLTSEAHARITAAQQKFNPTEEERNPNLKFVENKITPIFAEDPDFNKLISKKKLSWAQYDVLLRHLYESIRDRKYFKDYLASEQRSIQEDAKLWVRIFESEFEDNAELADILEDLSIYWNDDLGYVLSWCRKTMYSIAEGNIWSLPALYNSDLPGNEAMQSDKLFVFNLVRAAYANFEDFSEQVAGLTPKWNKDRLCTTDLALIVCGMAESKSEPGTPIKIIINEYVELSKSYSTPDSSGFVNGLLDKLINKH